MADSTAPAAAAPDPSTQQTELANLTAAASQKYALKHYAAAADLYSQAANLQSELRDEMDPLNADILYRYGRSLYHVGVAKSDVLGGKVAGGAEGGKGGVGQKRKREDGDVVAEKVVEMAVEGKEGVKGEGAQQQGMGESKPFFQITGDDDDWEDEDSDAEDGAADGEANDEEDGDEEEENDFATAYEVLDLSRLLFTKQIDTLTPDSTEETLRPLRANLADTHDLLAEISLEDERFADAIPDATASLDLKKQLHAQSSNLVAEAHFKLSLALEFASMPTAGEEAVEMERAKAEEKAKEGETSTAGANAKEDSKINWDLRNQAVEHMQSAISSSKLRLQDSEAQLASAADSATKSETAATVTDIQEILADMEQRVRHPSPSPTTTTQLTTHTHTQQIKDLRSPPPSTSDPTPAADLDPNNPLTGILGSILGESPAEQRMRIEEATRGARDLTGLVRSGPKRKAGEEGEGGAGENGEGKRAKLG